MINEFREIVAINRSTIFHTLIKFIFKKLGRQIFFADCNGNIGNRFLNFKV